MKRTFLFTVIAATLFMIVSCGGEKKGSDNPALELVNSVEFSEDSLATMITSEDTLTDIEYEALFQAFSKLGIDREKLDFDDDFITNILYDVLNNYEYPSNAKQIQMKLMKDESPQVRAMAVYQKDYVMEDYLEDSEIKDEILTIFKGEKDPFVIKQWIKILWPIMYKSPGLFDFFYSHSDDENPELRRQCGETFIFNYNPTFHVATDEQMKKLVELAIKYMKDSDNTVRKNAYGSCGHLLDESVIPELEKILNNPNESELHYECLSSLYYLWYNWPFFRNTSKAAYDVTLNYLKKTPRNENMPPWLSIGHLTSRTDNYQQWRDKATYFDEKEWTDVMIDIAKDADAHEFARTHTIKVIALLGTKNDLEKLKTDLSKNAADEDKDGIIEEIDKNLKEL